MLANIELDRIEPNPWQPRKTFLESELLELGESIKKEGLRQAIGLRPHPEKRGIFQIIWGERRVRASRMVGLQTLKSEVMSATDHEMKRWAVLENYSKQYENPLEIALSTKMLLNTGMSLTRVAKVLGRKRGLLESELALLNLPPKLQNEVAKGTMYKTLGMAIGKLPSHLHMEAYRATEGRTLKYALNVVYALDMKSKGVILSELSAEEKEEFEKISKTWKNFKKVSNKIMDLCIKKRNLMIEVVNDITDTYFIKRLVETLKNLEDNASKHHRVKNLKS